MPKEVIRMNHSPSERGPWNVTVGWAQDQEVQLATECYGTILRSAFSTNQALQRLGEHLGEALDIDVEESPNQAGMPTPAMLLAENVINALEERGLAFSGMYVDLNRSEINKLIRILRRARDSAYGRDE